jgi:adenylylsulfate kinase-like enzyme
MKEDSRVLILDGDQIRQALNDDLGYSEPERIIQVRYLQGLAKLFAEQGMIVLVPVLYTNSTLLDWNRKNLPNYFEIFLRHLRNWSLIGTQKEFT